MARKKPTPEEQLLNLIEKEEGLGKLRPKRKRFPLFNFIIKLKNLLLFLPSLKRTLRNKLTDFKKGIKEPNLKSINRVLTGVSIILISYLITDFTFGRPDIKKIYKGASAVRGRRFKEPETKEARPFLYYLAMVQRRNIFSPFELKSAESSQAEARKTLATLIKDLSLVGVSWGKEPQAMIEDTKAKRTYFLNSGDMINNLKIDTILKDRVILSYEGEKMELM